MLILNSSIEDKSIEMKRRFFHAFVPAACAAVSSFSLASEVFAQTVDISRSTNANMNLSGTSGGSVDSKGCGFISQSPSQIIKVTERIDYLRLRVQSNGGKPTLLIKGPSKGDRFCALADGMSSNNPEISGVWEPGTYQIFVGDLNGSQHPYTLNVSKQK
jgi:hypothetical protein